jgi:hypothetical protein
MTQNTTFIHWRKSSRSSGGDNCVEIASAADGRAVGVRDSKLGRRGPVLEFTPGEWASFLAGAKTGQFDRS